MYGNHDYETASRIAAEKTSETGKTHTALPSQDDPNLYTIGVEIKGISGKEFKANLLKRLTEKPIS